MVRAAAGADAPADGPGLRAAAPANAPRSRRSPGRMGRDSNAPRLPAAARAKAPLHPLHSTELYITVYNSLCDLGQPCAVGN